MNKKLGGILLYVGIVLLSIFIVIRRLTLPQDANINKTWNYIILAFFILFTYINLRKLIQLIKNYKK
ncbi:hypothetical protein [Moheibacter stercoris]|uniref:Uncharacterized protein n=1 Tax=Moheibacter stercoris TaxID=1628251 RepID=A0ABV2LVS2_9FLAO